jgi:hypothetical protein
MKQTHTVLTCRPHGTIAVRQENSNINFKIGNKNILCEHIVGVRLGVRFLLNLMYDLKVICLEATRLVCKITNDLGRPSLST